MECTRATRHDVPGIGALFLEAFADSVIHTCGKIPHFSAVEDLFSCVYEAEPQSAFIARGETGEVIGYVLAPIRISNLWKTALWKGHLLRWAWRWIKGDYGFGLYPVKIMFMNKIEFFRSAFAPQIQAEARILSVAVSEKARGQGIATYLMECALKHFAEHGTPMIRLEVRPDNMPTKRVYEKLGFVDAGYTRDSQGDWLIMLKEMEH